MQHVQNQNMNIFETFQNIYMMMIIMILPIMMMMMMTEIEPVYIYIEIEIVITIKYPMFKTQLVTGKEEIKKKITHHIQFHQPFFI